jgi:predicted ATP-dependent serine protease
MRLKEAEKLGFKAALAPAFGEVSEIASGLRITPLKHLIDLATQFSSDGEASERGRRVVAS